MIEVELPDGTVAEFPDGTPNDVIQGALRKRFQPQSAHPEFDLSNVPGRQPSGITAALSSAVEGVPVVGPYLQSGVENAAAGIGSLLSGQPQSQVRAEMGQMVDEAQAAYPKTSMAASVAGGVAGTLPAVMAAPAAFGAGGGPLLARMLAGGASGAAIGGADAGVRDGLGAVPLGAGLGFAFGAAAPGVGDLIGKGVSAVSRRAAGVSPAQARFDRALSADAVDDVAGRLAQMGPDAMPMDLGPNLQRQAGALAATPGRNQEIVRSAIANRQNAAGGRIAGALDDALGQNVDTIALADDIIAKRAAASKPLYDAAYSRPIPFTQELEELLTRPSVGKALSKARALAADEGIPSPQWFANIADDGAVTIKNVPDVRQLDLTKRALDDMISNAQRAGNNNEARIFTQLKNKLVGMMDQAVPEYAQARAAFSGPSAVVDALEEGQKAFSSNLTPNQLRTQLLKMGDAEKEAFVQGARAQVAQIMGTARNDALAARTTFMKGWNKEKLEILLGRDQAGKLLQSLESEAAFTRTRDVVTGNSETAARLAAQKDVGTGATADHGVLRSALNLRMGDAAASALERGVGGIRSASQQKANDELARLLTSRDPQAVTRLIKTVQTAQRRGDITAQRAREIIQSFAVGPGTQQPRQPLELMITPSR